MGGNIEEQNRHAPIAAAVDEGHDEEEGGDTIGELPAPLSTPVQRPPARPSLHGLDREFSTRFGALPTTTTTTSNNNNDGQQQQEQQQQQQRAPNFNDYLKAQRTLQSRRHLAGHLGLAAAGQRSTSTRALLTAMNREAAGDDDFTSSNPAQQQPPSPPPAEPQFNFSVLTAAAKFRKFGRTASSNANNNTTAMSHPSSPPPRASSFDWDEKFREIELIDEDGHFIDGAHESTLPLYSPPVQRQRWGEDQMLPHVNWGDLFFDLFYVAAAYNLGSMLTTAMNSEHWLRGCIYYVGTFGPLWGTWEVSMFHESRYTSVDYAHRLFEVVRYLFVSTAVLHVKTVDLLGDPKSAETLVFTGAIFCEAVMHLALCIELYYRGEGDRDAIRNHTAGKIKFQLMPVLLGYLAAVIAAAVNYAQDSEEEKKVIYDTEYDDSHYRHLASATAAAAAASEGYETYEESASSEPTLWKTSDLPLTLMAVAYLLGLIVTAARQMRISSGKHGDIRDRYVPNNVDYVIHRYGEWILLMIGEGILSLLIVETVEVRDYYIITTFGVLTVLKVNHRMQKDTPCVLSMSLIVFGVTYKVFLKGILKEKEKEDAAAAYGDELSGNTSHRMLAASPYISDDVAADVFSGSLVVVLLSLELMCLTHSGYKKALGHLVRPLKHGQEEGGTAMPHWPVVIIALLKVGIILFTLTLSQWTVDPAVIVICGCCIVFALAVTRVLNFFFIHKKEVIQNLTETVRNTVGRASVGGISLESNATAACKGMMAMARISASSHSPLLDEIAEETHVRGSDHPTDSAFVDNESKDGPAKDLASATNSSFDGYVVADLNGIITQVNDTAVTLFAYTTKKEMIGKNLSILVGGSDGKRHDGYVKSFKERHTTKDNPHHSKVLGRQRMLHACRADGTEFPCIIGSV
ncbi:hypothetical protein ACHAXR_009774 [Thalassiosira sp. AJA248-18]